MLQLIIFCLVASFLPAGAQAESRLRVVTLLAPPMVIDDGGELSGLALELARKGLKRAGYEVEIELAPWKRAVYMTKHGEADALFYAVYNAERSQYFHYPETPLFNIDLVLLKRKTSSIVISLDRKGLDQFILGIGRGFAYGDRVRRFIEQAQFIGVAETASNDLNFAKLIDGRIDLLLADRALARHFLEKTETKGLTEYVRDEDGNVAVLDKLKAYLVFSKVKSSAVDAQRFSDALDGMIADGTYQEILDQYQ